MSQTPISTPDPTAKSPPVSSTEAHNTYVRSLEMDTKIIHGGPPKEDWTSDPLKRSVVNPPVYHASTVTFPTMDSLRYAASDWPFKGLWYGRHGNPTTFALEEAYAAIEGAYNACLTGSGVAAVNVSILAFVSAGDHILLTDAIYDPSRSFCDKFLKRFGVETTYFSPTASPDAIEALIRPNSKLILVESPASLSFEVMDIPAIADRAHAHGLKVLVDNTYGPSLFLPFQNGCDVAINAITKYIGGHSDLMMGIITTKDAASYRAVKKSLVEMGCPPGSDDAYLAYRGLKTLSVRLRQHEKNAIAVATWLEQRDEIIRVMNPALPSHPQHALFKSQFNGSCGLFGLQLREGYSQKAVDYMLDGMKLFCLGFSWGGYESLLLQTRINSVRSVDKWKYGDGYGQTLRAHIGLEDVSDLIRDLDQGFERLNSFKE